MRNTPIKQNRSKFWRSLLQLEPGQPAIAKALRTLAAIAGAVLLGQLAGGTSSAIIITIGALFVSFADVGGAYQTKATAMGAATVGIAVTMLVGTLVGGWPWLYVPLMFLWGFGAGFVSVYGKAATGVGLVVALSFIISFSPLSQLGTASERFWQLMVGGAWSMLLSLMLWPLKPDKPAIDAVADCYRVLAGFITASYETVIEPVGNGEEHTAEQEQDAVRNALELARNRLTATRLAWPGQSAMGDQLLELLHLADRIFGLMIALAHFLETATEHRQFNQVQALVKDAMEQTAQAVRALAKAIARGGAVVDIVGLERIIDAIRENWHALRATPPARGTDYQPLIDIGNVVKTIEKLSGQLHVAIDMAKCLRSGSGRINHYGFVPAVASDRASVFATLLENLNFHSVVFRHALRLGLTTGLAVMVGLLSGLPRGYWVTLSVMVILKPDIGLTKKRALQRVGGTILGGVLAVVVAVTIHNQLVLVCIMVLLMFVAISLQPLNYGFSTVLLTPLVVLLFNLMHPGDLQIAGIRILDTVIGGAIALFGGYLLWPSWERQRFPEQLASTLHANQTYFQRVMAGYLVKESDRQALRHARQQAEIENSNAAASFQRLLEEQRKPPYPVEPLMVLITYTRSFSNTVTAIAAHLGEFSGKHELPGLDAFRQQIERTLADLEAAVKGECLSQALPPLDRSLNQIHSHLQELYASRAAELTTNQGDTPTREAVVDYAFISTLFDRLADQVTMMHSALVRMCDSEG